MTAFRLQTFSHQCVSYRSETVSGHPAEYLPAFGSQPVLNSDPVRCICGNIQIFKAQSLAFMNHAPWMKINSNWTFLETQPCSSLRCARTETSRSQCFKVAFGFTSNPEELLVDTHTCTRTRSSCKQDFFFFFPLVVACDSHHSCGSVGCFKRHSRGGSSPIR